jgi:hypothetical protein
MAKGSFKPARVWAGFRRTIQVHVVHPCPSPRLTTPDKTSEHECVFLPFSSFSTLLQVQRATHYLIRFHFTSTSNLGLKNYLQPYMNEPLRFIRNYLEFHMGQAI